MIKGCIFDLDGTVLDSSDAWDDVGEGSIKALGIEVKENLTETIKTFSLKQAAEYMQEHYLPHLSVDDIIQNAVDYVASKYNELLPLKAGVKEYLKKLYDQGYRLVIFTAGDATLTKNALVRLGVYDLFEEIYSTQTINMNKSDPASYQEVARRMGLNVDECVVYEDAYHGMESAKKAGFKVQVIYDKKNKDEFNQMIEIADGYAYHYDDMKIME